MNIGFGVVSVIVVSVLGMGIGFVYQILLAKYLGEANYGIYSYAIALLSLGTILSVGGVSTGVKRYIPELQESNRLYQIGSYFVVSTVWVLLISACLFSLYTEVNLKSSGSQLFPEPSYFLYLLLFGSCLLYFLCELLRSLQSSVLATFFETVLTSAVVLLVLMLYGFSHQLGVVDILNIRMLVILSVCIIIMMLLKGRVKAKYTTQLNEYPIRQWFSPLLNMHGIAALGMLRAQFDVLILALFVGPAEVGVYAITKRLSAIAGLPFVASTMYFVPKIIKQQAGIREDSDTIRKLFRANCFVTCSLGIFIFTLLMLVSRHLAEYLTFDVAMFSQIVCILGLGHVALLLGGPCVNLLTLQGSDKWVVKNTAISVVLSIILMLLLGHTWAERGVAAASSIGQVFFVILCVWYYKRNSIYDTSVLCIFDRTI